MPTETSDDRWSSPWIDALAFAVGLGVAWRWGWSTTDLVWSLWLSSLVVGYSSIVWTIVRPVMAIGRGVAGTALSARPAPATPWQLAGAGGIAIVGGLFVLAFFTFHFGMFHYVHSQFLNGFFPVGGGETGKAFAGLETYAEVARRYWPFLPAAFLAERDSFTRPAASLGRRTPPSGRAAPDERARAGRGSAFAAPYRNVVRMHMLIFFFAAVHFAGADNFGVYAVVYAVYFFPWREMRRRGAELAQEG